MKKIYILSVIALFVSFSFVSAQTTPPAPGTDPDSISYIFYLYYNGGQLFRDRDFAVNYAVANEKYVPETAGAASFKGEIINSRAEVVKTFNFDPQKGDANFKMGKVTVKSPYAPDGFKANFYDSSGKQLPLAIFVSDSAICSLDGFCNAQVGEDNKTCPADCPVVRATPSPISTELPASNDGFNFMGFDLIQILIYVVGTLGVGVIGWLGWKWWKKKKEGDFPLPPPPPSMPQSSFMPPPPNAPLG